MSATSDNPTSSARSAEEIQDWIQTKIAAEMQVEPQTIDPRQPFTSFGIDSIAIFTLTGDLAEWMSRDLRATLLWEYPDIASLSRYLAEDDSGT